MLTISTVPYPVPTTFSPTKALDVAARLQAGDPEWTYTVRDDPEGAGGSVVEN